MPTRSQDPTKIPMGFLQLGKIVRTNTNLNIMKKLAFMIACTATMALISCNDANKRSNADPSGANPANPTATPPVQDRQGNMDRDTIAGGNMQENKMGAQDISKMYNTLELTDQQKEKLDNVQKKYEDRMKNTGGQSKGQQMDEATRGEMEREIRAILTPDQFKRYQEMKKAGNKY